MPRTRCPGDLPVVVTAVVARTAVLTWLMIAGWALVAAALGAETTTVVSDSMAPALRTGDVVAVVPRPAGELEIGQVLLVDDPDRPGALRMHRLESVAADGLRLRGDANEQADSSLVLSKAVHGVGVLRFPTAGLPSVWVRDGDVAGPAVASAVAFALLLLARLDDPVRSGAPCHRCGTPRATVGQAGTTGGRHSRSLVTAFAAALVAAMLASDAGSSFSGTTGSTGAFASVPSYPCFRDTLDDPVLAWDFDEPGGTTVLDRAGDHDGVVLGQAFRQDRSCAEDPFMRFTASADSPRVVSSTVEPAPETYTLEAWFRTDQPQGVVASFGSDASPASSWKDRIIYVRVDGRLAFGLQGANDGWRRTIVSDGTVADGAWHHVVVSVTPGDARLFLDGSPAANRSDVVAGFVYDGSWRIGRQSVAAWEGAGAASFLGDVDSFRVYDRVLTPDAVAAHHAAGR